MVEEGAESEAEERVDCEPLLREGDEAVESGPLVLRMARFLAWARCCGRDPRSTLLAIFLLWSSGCIVGTNRGKQQYIYISVFCTNIHQKRQKERVDYLRR
jgi:hypothetical protein